jgi:signal transduction histidine kinase/CheY-like chemotaxis protein
MLLLQEKSGSGSTARFTTPAILVAIPLVHWLCNQGMQRGYFDRGTGDALANLTLIMAALVTLWNALMAVRRHEIALRDADRRKDEFLATLAHELRNPLAPLQSGLEVIKLSVDGTEPVAKVVQTMQGQVSHLTSLVDDLLDISRISTGKLKLRQSYVVVSEVIRNAVELSRPLIEQRSHQLRIEQPSVDISLYGDPHRLNQILSNMIHNAAKYTPPGGNIWIAVRPLRGEVDISVRDDGIGIAKQHLTKVFEMFAQVRKPAAFEYMGLGIGLSLVQSLVKMHGGSIRVSSDGEGKGATFVVHLPTVKAPPVTSQTTAYQPPESMGESGRKVLVVDDNVAAAKTLSTLIKMLGNDVRTATNGQEAVEMAEEFQPELIIMDIGMPVMDGYDAARTIRSMPWGQHVRLVALTGWGQESDIQKSRSAGFDQHLVKPVELAAIQSLLSGATDSAEIVTKDEV